MAAAQRLIERRKGVEESDPGLFAQRVGVAPDPWQLDLLRAKERQIILLCARQSGKSLATSLLALHQATYTSGALILLLSPSLRQSAELLKKVKAAYDALAAKTVTARDESALRMEFSNGARIIALPGQEQTIRGFSCVTLLVVDEASRVSDDLYQACRPMLAVSAGRIVLLSTPFGQRGFFHHEWMEGGSDWHRTKLTAFECPRISREWLENERKRIDARWFAQEYLVEFVEREDSVFRYDDIAAALDSSVTPLF